MRMERLFGCFVFVFPSNHLLGAGGSGGGGMDRGDSVPVHVRSKLP
jgi:hypothetical protein